MESRWHTEWGEDTRRGCTESAGVEQILQSAIDDLDLGWREAEDISRKLENINEGVLVKRR
jgi:hypothetical protein